MDLAASQLRELTRRARVAAQHAYAPYSKFAVGAAVLTAQGEIYAGANVENASYGLSMCAERNAIFHAVAQGSTAITALAVYTPTRTTTTPCGACRQVLAEFGADIVVLCCCDAAGGERRYRLADLLPDAFGPHQL